jgi:hypothetical protein
MLHQELKLDGENGRLMELIIRESDRLDRIISDFLDFAKIRQPKKMPARLDKCLSETMVLLKKNTEKSASISIRLECAEDMPLVYMDDEQMRQVFMNLAVNSCEAMEKGGTLEVIAGPTGAGHVRVAFCDSGPGIEAEGKERLFEPFFTSKDGGTGLGLAIANKIVVAHGGTIEYRNREQGGAVFTITFPIIGTGEHEARPATVHEPAKQRAQHGGDDEAEGERTGGHAALPSELVEDRGKEQRESRACVHADRHGQEDNPDDDPPVVERQAPCEPFDQAASPRLKLCMSRPDPMPKIIGTYER